MAFLHKYNTDDIFVRAIIIGFINLLNNKIKIDQVLSDDNTEVVEIPWFFDQSGEEDFMQNYFTHWSDCVHPKLSDGNYDILPRGIIKLGGIGISTGNLTNKYVRGTYTREVNGVLETFTAFVRQIPMTVSFEAEIKADTFNQSMKIMQTIIETFYSTQIFRTSYKGFMIPCQAGFPDSYDLDKMMEYSYGDGEDKMINLSFEVETYLPQVNKESEMHSSKRIHNFAGDINPNVKEIRGFRPVTPISDNESVKYYDGGKMLMEWTTLGNIRNVNIDFSISSTPDDWKPIAVAIENRDYYEWNIREFNIKRPNVVIKNQDFVIKPATLLPIINLDGTLKHLIVMDGGMGYDNTTEIDILESGAETAEIIPQIFQNSIYKISDENIISRGSGFTPPHSKTINLRISDSYDGNNYITIENIWIT